MEFLFYSVFVAAMSATQSLKEDDVGPLLTLGDRVVWLFEHGPEHGWVRWIGRIPVVSPNWAIGVEFVSYFQKYFFPL